MAPHEVEALVVALCRNLALLRRCADGDGDGDGARQEVDLLARYRAVVDALGCRETFEQALLQQVLRPPSVGERGARSAEAG